MSTNNNQNRIDVKNLCSRKLLELYASRAVADTELNAVIDELQLRRHYLNELERLQSPQATRH